MIWEKGEGLLSKKGGLYYNFSLPYIIMNKNLDLFWGSQQVTPPILPSKLPVVLTYCDLVLYLYPGTMRRLALLQQKLFQNISVNKADYILSISENTRRDLIQYFNYPVNKTDVAYPGVDPLESKRLSEQKPSEEIARLGKGFLLTVSTIEPRKNYPFLLEVFREYRKISGKNKRPWVIAGKIGWEKEEFLSGLKKDSEEYKDIILIENADDVGLQNLYKNCEIFLFASIYEGFGIPLLEALVYKKKCIVSDIPTFREIGGNEIKYLSLESPMVWAEKILELQNMDIQPEIRLEKFSWKESAKITKQAFDLVLNK
jgi:glycosyltransferase involved in cell wall biosynthesis